MSADPDAVLAQVRRDVAEAGAEPLVLPRAEYDLMRGLLALRPYLPVILDALRVAVASGGYLYERTAARRG